MAIQAGLISIKARWLARPKIHEKNFNTAICQPYFLWSAASARAIPAGSSIRLARPSAHSPRTLPLRSQAAIRTRSFALSRFILADVPLVTAQRLGPSAAIHIGVATAVPLRRKVARLT